MYSHCENGGWILGHLIDGTQAEYVRIPFADNSLYHIPEGSDEEALVMLSDILPTGFECGVLNGKVQPGNTVAIVGSGPIGLAALLTAQFYAPAEIIMIDPDDNRLETAKKFGATQLINNVKENAVDRVKELTGNRGVDTVIEAVGIPATFELCQSLVGAGGTIANIGVHGKSAILHLETLWAHNITITTRLVDTVTTPMLLKTIQSKKLDSKQLITHHFKLREIVNAYDTFEHAARERGIESYFNQRLIINFLKMYITPEEAAGLVKSGSNIFIQTAAAAPQQLIRALTARAHELSNIHIYQMHTEGEAPYAAPGMEDIFHVNCFFIGANLRKAVQEGRATIYTCVPE